MTEPLSVGVPVHATYVRQMLFQSGIRAAPLNNIAEGVAAGIRIFFWNDFKGYSSGTFGREGGLAFITNHASLASLLGMGFESLGNSYYFQLDDPELGQSSFMMQFPSSRIALRGKGTIRDNKDQPVSDTGIVVYERGNDLFISLPWDLTKFRPGARWGYRPYFSSAASKHFVEIGPAVDSGSVRRLVVRLLGLATDGVGIPAVLFPPHAHCKKSFGIRVDCDVFSLESFEATLRLANDIRAKFTWFINVESWGNNLKFVRALMDEGQDVQLHCYYHDTYPSQIANFVNLWIGKKLLGQFDVHPLAAASPFGYSFEGYMRAVEMLGFHYSSEFGLAVDDLPFFPREIGRLPMQIPVHPGCVGLLKDFGFSDDEVFRHLESVAIAQVEAEGVVFLYDHPLDGFARYENEYRQLLRGLSARGYEHVNLTNWYQTWASAFASLGDGNLSPVRPEGSQRDRSDDLTKKNAVKWTDPAKFEFPPGDILRIVQEKTAVMDRRMNSLLRFGFHLCRSGANRSRAWFKS